MGSTAEDQPSNIIVDQTMVVATLQLSVVERLRQNDRMSNLAARLKSAFTAAVKSDEFD